MFPMEISHEMYKKWKKDGSMKFEVEGKEYDIPFDCVDWEFKPKPGFVVSENVALDIRMTPEILEEAAVREIIHFIQGERKKMDLEYNDRIHLKINTDNIDLYAAMLKNSKRFKSELLADSITHCKIGGGELFKFRLAKKNSTIYYNPKKVTGIHFEKFKSLVCPDHEIWIIVEKGERPCTVEN